MKQIVKRATAPTPKFFKILRTVGLALAAIGGTLLASPVVLPTVLVTVGGYIAVAGGVLTAASQLSVRDDFE